MRVIVKRSLRGTLSALVNFGLAAVTSVVIFGNQMVAEKAGLGWLIVAGLLALWALVILSGLLRPVRLAVDEGGVDVARLLGRHRFTWDQLSWADFDTSDRFAILAARVEGQDKFAALSKRGLQAEAFAQAVAAIRAARPDLPNTRPATG